MYHDDFDDTIPVKPAAVSAFTKRQLILRRLALLILAPISLVFLVCQEFGEGFMFFIRGVRVEFRTYRKVVRAIWTGEAYE